MLIARADPIRTATARDRRTPGERITTRQNCRPAREVALQAAFIAAGWRVQADDRGYHGTSRDFFGSRSGYSFAIRPVWLDGTTAAGQFFTASTPCLRAS